MSKPNPNAATNGKHEWQLLLENETKPLSEKFKSIEYNFANEIDWAEWSDFDKLKARDAILLLHGLNPSAYQGGVPPRVRQNGEALDFFRKVKHWLDVVESETAESKTAAEWLAWADKKQLPVHSEFRAMVAKTTPTDAMPESKTVITPEPNESAPDSPSADSAPKHWKMKIQAEAARMFKALREAGCSPTKNNIKSDLAKWCRDNGVKADGDIFPSAEYIARHVIGKGWKPPN